MSKPVAAILAGTDFGEADVPALQRVVDTADEGQLASRLEAVRIQAFNEYLGWATARRRFNSISELDAARVLALFLGVRKTAPSVGVLVEDLGLPQGRATSMLGRMKYGEARALVALSFAAAATDVEARLADAPEEGSRKAITTSREVVDRISEVEHEILSAPASDLGKNGKYESAEAVTILSGGRYGATVSTSTKTWGYIVAKLKTRGEA